MCRHTWTVLTVDVHVSVSRVRLVSSGRQEVGVTYGAHVSAVPLVALPHQSHDQILQLG